MQVLLAMFLPALPTYRLKFLPFLSQTAKTVFSKKSICEHQMYFNRFSVRLCLRSTHRHPFIRQVHCGAGVSSRLWQKVGYTKNTHTHMQGQIKVLMFLDCMRKPEYMKKTCKLHAEIPQARNRIRDLLTAKQQWHTLPHCAAQQWTLNGLFEPISVFQGHLGLEFLRITDFFVFGR